MIKTCELCGCAFDARRMDVKTCSPACKRKLLSRTMQIKYARPVSLYGLSPKRCAVCGAAYEPSSGNQLTCSRECRNIWKRQRAAERRQPEETETVFILPLHLAESVCRRLGMSYGEAGAEAVNAGVSLSRYLTDRAACEGIEISKEAEA